MKGFGDFYGQKVDWAKFTLANRILDNGVPYKQIAQDWQTNIDKAICNYQNVYLQLARGHDKTDRFAWWSLIWLMTTRASRGYCAGVDADNARLFRDASRKLKALHPELFAEIDVQKNTVLHKETGSYIETISSDADSAYGLNFDLLIINDFHAWPDEKFWEVLWTACGKKPGIRVWMESNALTLGTEGAHWVYKQRKAISQWADPHHKDFALVLDQFLPLINRKENPCAAEWFYFKPRGFLANWQMHKLTQWQQSMHPAAYARLINNEDSSGDESFVTVEQVNACVVLKSNHSGWATKKDRAGITITTVDLGLKKDSTAVATVWAPPVPRGSPPVYMLLDLNIFRGSTDDPVKLDAVEQCILLHHKRFHADTVLIDPWGAPSLVQKHPRLIVEWPFTAAHVRELTLTLYRAIADRNLQIYPNAGAAMQDGEEWTLERELTNAVVKDMSYGQRVDHKAGGYSDRLMAMGMAIHYLSSEVNIQRTATPAPKPEPQVSTIASVVKDAMKQWTSPTTNGKLTLG